MLVGRPAELDGEGVVELSVEVEYSAGLGAEVGVAAEEPGAHRQGLIASSASRRQIVEAEASVTPRSTTRR